MESTVAEVNVSHQRQQKIHAVKQAAELSESFFLFPGGCLACLDQNV